MALVIPFDPSGLDPKVVGALDDIIASIQTWSASPFGLATKRMRVQTVAQTVTTGVDPFPVTWQRAPSGSGNDDTISLYDTGGFLDSGGVFINFTQPGTYLISAELSFAANATGMRYTAIMGTSDADYRKMQQVAAGSAASTVVLDSGTLLFHVASPPRKLRVAAWQNSGVGLAISGTLQVVQLLGS